MTSIVEDQGRHSSTCGYCNSKDESMVADGMWAHVMTVADYQQLLDRGWRRSGKYLYKPSMAETCCPPYTIRLPADEFVPTKEHNRVLRRMQRYLDGTLSPNREGHSDSSSGLELSFEGRKNSSAGTSSKGEAGAAMAESLSQKLRVSLQECLKEASIPKFDKLESCSVRVAAPKVKKQMKLEEGEDLFTSNVGFVIAAEVKRLAGQQSIIWNPTDICRIVAEQFEKLRYGIKVEASSGHLNFYVKTDSVQEASNEMATDTSPDHHQSGAHQVPMAKSTEKQTKQLEILTTRSSFNREEFELYKKYQMRVHGDREEKLTKSSYMRFLVDSPLVPSRLSPSGRAPPVGYGSFHQQYRIDGQLIAVGVIDILPACLSSKYLFWDPDLAFLSLGKFSALKEIEWVRENHQVSSELQYYYLGYYIHDCPKMKYKASYSPSYLLCPLSYQWYPYSSVSHHFDGMKLPIFCRMDTDEADNLPQNSGSEAGSRPNSALLLTDSQEEEWSRLMKAAVQETSLLIGQHCVHLKNLYDYFPRDVMQTLEKKLMDFGRNVGQELMTRMRYTLDPGLLMHA